MVTLLPLIVLVIFAVALMAIWAFVSRTESQVRPILLHRDEQSLHHHRNCPGPGAD